MFIYIVVGKKVETFDSVKELTKIYKPVGIVEGYWLREELIGQPMLEGLVGAMYDGMRDGKHVIRYETPELYNMLSS